MSWAIAIVVALITAVITGIVTAYVADHVTKAMKVSNFEGARGYMVMFLVVGAVLGGLIIGGVTTHLLGASSWSVFWKAQTYAILVSNGLVFAIAGLFLLSIPKKPLLDGEEIALQVEVHVPRDLAPRSAPDRENLRMSLYAGKDDNHYVDIDLSHLGHEEGALVIHAEASLNTVSAGRMLSITIDGDVGYTLDMPLRPVPRKEDLDWTARMPMRLSRVTNASYERTRVLARYRVITKGRPKEA